MIRVTLMHVEDTENQMYDSYMPAVPSVGQIIMVELPGEDSIHYVVRNVEWAVPGRRWKNDRGSSPEERDALYAEAHKDRYGPLVLIDDAVFSDELGRFVMKQPIA